MRFWRALFRVLAVVLLGAALGMLGLVGLYGRNLPDVRQLGQLTRRDPASVSLVMRAVVVQSEDRRFYAHGAIDPLGLLRAGWRGLRGGALEGGSTLTQQLVKNTLLARYGGARTLERKVREALLAVRVERTYSKAQILTAYLHAIYWGSGGARDLIGVQDAARAYFGVPARQLDLAQSVYLTTLIPAPARYFNYAAQRPRMHELLNDLVQAGTVSPAEAGQAWREPLQPAGWQVRYTASGSVLQARLVNPDAKDLRTPTP